MPGRTIGSRNVAWLHTQNRCEGTADIAPQLYGRTTDVELVYDGIVPLLTLFEPENFSLMSAPLKIEITALVEAASLASPLPREVVVLICQFLPHGRVFR